MRSGKRKIIQVGGGGTRAEPFRMDRIVLGKELSEWGEGVS